jgi:2-phospho-L-lactate guanylyltransferase (CobY/MobA/RfbA family)
MLWTVIPVKEPKLAKTRLSPTLSNVARERLVRALIARTLMVARTFAGARPVMI